jgi:hypothetical protein
MLVKLIDVNDTYKFRGLLEFIDAAIDSNMRHYASEIIELVEMGKEEELRGAMLRAQEACRVMGIPLENHFKKVYRDAEREVVCDYKLSPLAFGLVCINASPANKNIARIQVEMVKKLMEK